MHHKLRHLYQVQHNNQDSVDFPIKNATHKITIFNVEDNLSLNQSDTVVKQWFIAAERLQYSDSGNTGKNITFYQDGTYCLQDVNDEQSDKC